eukprot:GEZU01005360.1.p1 GENE.GEZU01005360.1~~GEZU01005360.1.p1  ORF type:complete len:735 (+),score=308.55 GEZU01005360.1:187-2391(+)
MTLTTADLATVAGVAVSATLLAHAGVTVLTKLISSGKQSEQRNSQVTTEEQIEEKASSSCEDEEQGEAIIEKKSNNNKKKGKKSRSARRAAASAQRQTMDSESDQESDRSDNDDEEKKETEENRSEDKKEDGEGKDDKEPKPFIVNRQTSGSIEHVYITIFDDSIISELQQYINNEEIYATTPKLEANELLPYLPDMKKAHGIETNDIEFGLGAQNNCRRLRPIRRVLSPEDEAKTPMRKLIDFLIQEFKEVTDKMDRMIKEGEISYNYLWYLFKKNTEFYGWCRDSKKKMGSKVERTEYYKSMFYNAFFVYGTIIDSNGQKFLNSTHRFAIGEFVGTKKIDELPITPMDPETKAMLTERGRKFTQVAIGAKYLHHTGTIYRKNWFFTNRYKADGRVMVDASSFARMNPDYDMGSAANEERYNYRRGRAGSDGSGDGGYDEVPEDKLYLCVPTVFGFSFTSKKWGEIIVDNLSDIVFDDNAFNRLVLEPEKKKLIQSLVENSNKTFGDIITGKGNGCIFLLHGTPGVGKTLTAEAIAELLHRPLYSVSVGELGTSTTELEQNLSEILEVASVWNAVVLIDEADIFLERRSENDIHRNALVGVFLRLLEYHQGVLFLTTNRVKSFDQAFHSRISVALKYSPLDESARAQVWRNFLEHANITNGGINVEQFSKYELNGRNIKSTIRLAKALAVSEGPDTPVTDKHIQTVLDVSRKFEADVLGSNDSNFATAEYHPQ